MRKEQSQTHVNSAREKEINQEFLFQICVACEKKIMKHYVPSLGLKDKHCQRRRVKKIGAGA